MQTTETVPRRRSRGQDDDGQSKLEAAEMLQPQARGKTTTRTRAVLALVCFVSLALISLYGLQGYARVPLLSLGSSSAQLGGSGVQSDTNSFGYVLHPERHVSRAATTLRHEWRVTSGLRRPDGVLKQVYLVNGVFPGPLIEARNGDRLIVNIHNDLETEGLSIHWHGLSMKGANEMDGAAGVTQAPIPPGSSFVYDFVIEDKYGTFWWHAHDGVQRADGLYGGLVLYPQETFMGRDLASEHLLLVSDWYHRSARDALQAYMHPGAFGLETVPDSVLVNGQGAFDCANAVPARPLDCVEEGHKPATSMILDLTKRTVIRIVNVGAYAGFTISMNGTSVRPIDVDGGHEVDGYAAGSIGVLHPGERVSVLVEPRPAAKESTFLEIVLDDTPFKYQNPALSLSHRFPVSLRVTPSTINHHPDTIAKSIDIQTVRSARKYNDPLPMNVDLTIVLYAITQKLARLANEPHGFINNTHWLPQDPPLLGSPRSDWDKDQFVQTIEPSNGDMHAWVDIVLNNLDEEGHPFHLHGHEFYVLSTHTSKSNWGSYNPFEDAEKPGGEYDLDGAVMKDTVYVPRRGYAVLRVPMYNPGLWMFHCHVLWHMASGMAMVFDVK